MDKNEIHQRLKKILVAEFEIDGDLISEDATLYDSLELDSLDGVDLIVAVESEFGFKIDRAQDEQVIRAMRTVEDVIQFIIGKMNQVPGD